MKMKESKVKIIECPRDGMQGLKAFIPTEVKITYINSLLKVGFDTLDVGSFVSPKVIPQLKDTAEVLDKIDLSVTKTKLLTIIGNKRGAKEAIAFPQVDYLGFPFSISNTFLNLNIRSDRQQAFNEAIEIKEICEKAGKELVVYISMAFGNYYGEDWSTSMVVDWAGKLYESGIKIIPLSDTVGAATPEIIGSLYSKLTPAYPDVEFGMHLHTGLLHWYKKLDAAYTNGCNRFDGVMGGMGGCPTASRGRLLGNMNTSFIVEYFDNENVDTGLDNDAFLNAHFESMNTFPCSSNLGRINCTKETCE